MSGEIAKRPVDPTLFPEAAHKHARRALREHQRAGQHALNAVQHAVKSGQALLKAYDLCEHGQWEGFFEMHFQQDPDQDQRLPLRTARTYMRLARNWSLLSAQHPAGFSSQRQAVKALAAIVQADKSDPSGLIPAARSRNADGSPAARSQARGTRRRTGPVWKASGPFVREALQVIDSVDAPMMELVAYGAPLTAESGMVRAALDRLRAMLERELDGAEAERAASQESDGEAGRTESGATAPTPALPRRDRPAFNIAFRQPLGGFLGAGELFAPSGRGWPSQFRLGLDRCRGRDACADHGVVWRRRMLVR